MLVDTKVPIGDYTLRWDLVIQDEAYFAQFAGLEAFLKV